MKPTAHPIDLTIFVSFLLVTLVVGLSYGRSVKTLRDYALGGKNFSTGTLVATIVATFYGGGSLFRSIEKTYSMGFYYSLATAGIAIGLFLSGQLAFRMREFLNNVSVAEAMGSMYGKSAQVITAVSGTLAGIGSVAIQFQVISRILVILFDLESIGASVVAAGIVILYSAFGGIKAVTFTDVIQFFTFGMVIPILSLVIWNQLQDPNKVAEILTQNPNFNLKEVVRWSPQFMRTVSLMLYFAIPGLTPALFQRIAMARDVNQARTALTYASGIALLLSFLLVWTGLLPLADNPNLKPNQVFAYIIDNYAYVGLKGLIAVGVMALAMSTADSFLNSSAVLFSNDIARPLTGQAVSSIRTAKLFSISMGVIALLLALYTNDLLKLLLLSGSLYMPVFAVPMLMAVIGFRTSTRAVLMSMATGFMTVVVWSIIYDNSSSVIPAMTANLVVLLGVHYLLGEPGGWQEVAPDSPLGLERAARRKSWKRQIETIKNFRIYPYLRQNLPDQEIFYFFFGLYTIAATYISLYTIGKAEIKAYQDIYQSIGHVTLFITTAFLTFPIWPPTVKSQGFITFFWPLGIGAVLFFAGTLLVILSGFHAVQVMVLMINLLIAVLLLRWPLAFMLSFLGITSAVYFFRKYTGMELPVVEYSLQFRVLYGMLLLASLLIALFRGKRAYEELAVHNQSLKETNQSAQENLLESFKEKARLVSVLRRSGISNLSHTARLIKELRIKDQDVLGKDSPLTDQLKQLSEMITPMALALEKVENRATDYLRLDVDSIAIDKLLEEVREQLRKNKMNQEVPISVHTRHRILTCDPARIRTLLVNGITVLQATVGKQSPVLVGIEDTQLGYKLPSVKEDYGKKVAAIRISITAQTKLPDLIPHYFSQLGEEPSFAPETVQALALSTNHRIVRAHYGYAEVIKEGEDILTLIYVIPVRIREVRPKDMDSPYMELGAELVRTNDAYPGAAEQEETFLAAVEKRTSINLELVKTAIEAIKWYHGPARRKSGEPFYLHPLAVAQIVLDYNQEEATLLGALLHDTVEDTPMLLENIDTMFGKEVASIVDMVTHLESSKEGFYRVQLTPHENTLMLLEVKDKRALYVKIADRMHNMRTISAKSRESQRKTAEETLQFFVPMAENLGLKDVATELKDRSMEVLSSH